MLLLTLLTLASDTSNAADTGNAAKVIAAGAVGVDARPLVVIDAGHGGWQQGTMGTCGLAEKDLTLAVARDIAELLEASEHVRTKLSRTDDYSITLERRAEIANRDHARLFVSVHGNASRSSAARGAETFFLSTRASNLRAERLAQLENEDAHDDHATMPNIVLDGIIDDMELTEVHRESQRLAQRLHSAMRGKMAGRHGRGVLQAPFRVLQRAEMPAALVEVGFLSHPDECALLATKATQRTIASAITMAILVHLESESPAVAHR